MDIYDTIRRLKQLVDENIITEEEFNQKKRELLGLDTPAAKAASVAPVTPAAPVQPVTPAPQPVYQQPQQQAYQQPVYQQPQQVYQQQVYQQQVPQESVLDEIKGLFPSSDKK